MSLITTQADYYVYNGGTSTELQNAINAAIAAGKSLFLVPPSPAAVVFQSNGLVINAAQGFKLFATPGSVTLKMSTTSDAVLTISNSNDVEVSGMNFDGGYVPGASSPITTNWSVVHAASSNRLRFEKCRFANGSTTGLFLDGCGTSQNGSTNPYGAAVTFDNRAAIVTQCEFNNTYSGAALHVSSSPGSVIRDNMLRDIKGNGIYVHHQYDAPGTTQSHFDGTLIEGNLITDVDVASAGTSGQEGNAIICWLCNNISILNNKMRYTRWSGARLNGCSHVVCNGNSVYGTPDVGIYIEQPGGSLTGKHPTGYTVVGNHINHCLYGINLVNFASPQGCRLGVIASNVIRHAHKSAKAGGIGIQTEGDVAVTGNTIECCDYFGIVVGTNQYSRDLLVANNLIRDCAYGVGTSSDTRSGAILVNGNLFHFAGADTNAVVATVYDPANANQAISYNRALTNLLENQTVNAWTKVTNNFRSTLTAATSPSDGCELAPVF